MLSQPHEDKQKVQRLEVFDHPVHVCVCVCVKYRHTQTHTHISRKRFPHIPCSLLSLLLGFIWIKIEKRYQVMHTYSADSVEGYKIHSKIRA